MKLPVLFEHTLDANHHGSGLFGVATGSDAEGKLHGREVQLIEERCGQGMIVVLTGMQHPGTDTPLTESVQHGSNLYEVRPRADNC